MNQRQLTPLLLSATLFLAAQGVRAADTPSATPAPAPATGPRHAEMLKQFDLNKDGQLDETERAALREQRRAQRMVDKTSRPGPRGERGMRDPGFRRGYILGKFDANGDGKLDETEKAALKAAGEKRMRASMEKRLQRLRAVDTDNDGKISDAEWTVAKEKFQAKRAARMDRGPGKGHNDGPPPPPPGPGEDDDADF